MRKLKQWIYAHEFERQSVYVDAGDLVQKCQKCGKRVREDRAAAI